MSEPSAAASAPLPAPDLPLAGVLGVLPDALFVLDAGDRFVYLNPPAARFVARPPEALAGLSLWDAFPQARGRRLEAEVRRVREGGAPVDYEAATEPPGRWLNVRVFSLDLPDGGRGTGILLRDVTERRREEERRTRLLEVTSGLAGAATTEEVVAVILGQAVPGVGAYAGSVCRLDGDGHTLAVLGAQGYEPGVLDPWARFDVSAGVPLADAVRENRPLFLNEAEYAARYGGLQRRTATRAAAALPLVARGRAIGAIGLSFDADHAFDASDRAFLDAIAQQCAIALDRAEARTVERVSRERLAFLARAGESLAASLDPDVVLSHLAPLAVPILADWCNVFVPAEDGSGLLEPKAIAHPDPALVDFARDYYTRFPLRVDAELGTGGVFHSGRPELIPELDLDAFRPILPPEQVELIERSGLRSVLVVPLVARGRTLGVLELLSTRPDRRYGEADLAFAQDLARRAALALDNARLHATLERRVEERTAELRARQAQLQAANAELEAFAYSASHDLRAPLRHIGSFATLLRRSLAEGESERNVRFLATIEGAAGRMNTLIDDLLTFSRAGRSEVRAGPLDLDRLARDVLRDLTAQAEAAEGRPRRVDARFDLPHDAWGDPALVRQVLTNLLGNALKYTRGRDEARVEVWAERAADEDVVFVRDNGVGFNPRYVDRLFGVFQRLHREEDFEGTGVGLALVKRIVEKHGGRVGARSEEGAGATFCFSLPRPGSPRMPR